MTDPIETPDEESGIVGGIKRFASDAADYVKKNAGTAFAPLDGTVANTAKRAEARAVGFARGAGEMAHIPLDQYATDMARLVAGGHAEEKVRAHLVDLRDNYADDSRFSEAAGMAVGGEAVGAAYAEAGLAGGVGRIAKALAPGGNGGTAPVFGRVAKYLASGTEAAARNTIEMANAQAIQSANEQTLDDGHVSHEKVLAAAGDNLGLNALLGFGGGSLAPAAMDGITTVGRTAEGANAGIRRYLSAEGAGGEWLQKTKTKATLKSIGIATADAERLIVEDGTVATAAENLESLAQKVRGVGPDKSPWEGMTAEDNVNLGRKAYTDRANSAAKLHDEIGEAAEGTASGPPRAKDIVDAAQQAAKDIRESSAGGRSHAAANAADKTVDRFIDSIPGYEVGPEMMAGAEKLRPAEAPTYLQNGMPADPRLGPEFQRFNKVDGKLVPYVPRGPLTEEEARVILGLKPQNEITFTGSQYRALQDGLSEISGKSIEGHSFGRQIQDAVHVKYAESLQKLSQELGEDWVDKYSVVNRDQASAALWSKSATAKEARSVSNTGFLEHGGAFGRVGASIGWHLGGPPGAVAGHVVGRAVDKYASRQAPFLLPNAINSVQTWANASRATRAVDNSIKMAVTGMLSRRSASASRSVRGMSIVNDLWGDVPRKERDEAVQNHINQMHQLGANISAQQHHVGQIVGDVSQHAPELGAGMSATAANKLKLAIEHLPKGSAGNALFKGWQNRRFTDGELQDYEQYMLTLNDPHYALDAMEHGRLTRNHVAALRDGNPEIYGTIRDELLSQLSQLKTPPTYQKVVQLSLMLGQPLDSSLEQDFTDAVQQTYKAGHDQKQEGSQGGGTAPSTGLAKRSEEHTSELQSLV